MKILYILKKGFHCYPPCLAQVLYLNDLGHELLVFHGDNSDYINNLFNERRIRHYTLKSDGVCTSRIQSASRLISYSLEALKLLNKYGSEFIVWFGNLESALFVAQSIKQKYVLSILELYNVGTLYDKRLKKIIKKAKAVICCETNRATIMKARYGLNNLPFVIPNKAYELPLSQNIELQQRLEPYKGKKILIYQGIIAADRPIAIIAKALAKISDNKIFLFVVGQSTPQQEEELKKIYKNTICWGYIPAPEHLQITSVSSIGIANYDKSSENNLYCAPNKIYEYGRFGLPMIVSTNPGLVQTVGKFKAGLCIDFSKEEIIINAINEIFSNYKAYSEAAYKLYTTTNNIEIMQKVVDMLSIGSTI